MSRTKPLPADPVARLEFVGHALYGAAAWQAETAKLMKVGRNTIGRWMSKIHRTPPDLDSRLAEAVVKRATEMKGQATVLDALATRLERLAKEA